MASRFLAQVATRANYRCEYCLSPQVVTAQSFHCDHVIPRAKGGLTTLDNLCYACPRCNLRKTDSITGVDPMTGDLTALFHPRQQTWSDHFAWSSDYLYILGLALTGRATVDLLQLNDEVLRRARQLWLRLKLIP
ncbi:MAG: HNH endonuclease [Caldilinea sp. CFX5]|nr:HNH endonuclease [Caldilinea sp. CFX5]